jgi:hypothetical protein
MLYAASSSSDILMLSLPQQALSLSLTTSLVKWFTLVFPDSGIYGSQPIVEYSDMGQLNFTQAFQMRQIFSITLQMSPADLV